MAGKEDSNHPGIIKACYNVKEREETVDKKLDEMLDKIQKENIHHQVAIEETKISYVGSSYWYSFLGPTKTETPKKSLLAKQDIVSIQLKIIETEISALNTHLVRHGGIQDRESMRGRCEKVIDCLDQLGICVAGREDLRRKKENYSRQAMSIFKQLSS